MGDSVEIGHHNVCCQSSDCECLPPPLKVEPEPQAEYRCTPIPPGTSLPVIPAFLKHLIMTPSDIDVNSVWILNQLPKRTCGQSHGKIETPAEGWGIYYEEDIFVSILLTVVLCIFATLLFAILWAKFQKDVQGGFGVSSFVITACGSLMAVLVARGSKP